MTERRIESELAGTVCHVACAEGSLVDAGASIIVVELMKMEFPVVTPVRGTLSKVLVAIGDPVAEGQLVAIVDEP